MEIVTRPGRVGCISREFWRNPTRWWCLALWRTRGIPVRAPPSANSPWRWWNWRNRALRARGCRTGAPAASCWFRCASGDRRRWSRPPRLCCRDVPDRPRWRSVPANEADSLSSISWRLRWFHFNVIIWLVQLFGSDEWITHYRISKCLNCIS